MDDDAGSPVLGLGLHFEDFAVGRRFTTLGRTIGDVEITMFVGLVGITEELFTNRPYAEAHSPIAGRLAPGALVYAVAEGLVLAASLQRTGIAFLDAGMKVVAPTVAGDTVHVDCEVIEARATRHADRGLVRTANVVVNQRGETVLTYNPLRMVRRRG
ncbi:MAG: acyl dehydratase [Sphingomonadales bacterium]|nr:MAG: acyl dehydratase [Sphingomonadales bacterium]